MAVTDYIFQEETVLKRDLGTWLVGKMVAAGWQQIGSNPPSGSMDSVNTRFYVMKSKRDSDNAEVIVGLNDYCLRLIEANYSMNLNIKPLLNYTPGSAGTPGTSTRGLTNLTPPSATGNNSYILSGSVVTAVPFETPLSVRYTITKSAVTLFVRLPTFFGVGPQMIFFGLPEFLQKEKTTGGSLVSGTGNPGNSNDEPIACDTILGVASSTSEYEIAARWLDPGKSPDAWGQFPLMPFFAGGSDTGIRYRIPSFFLLRNGGILDRDVIQVNGMNFEVAYTEGTLAGINTKTLAYRIS